MAWMVLSLLAQILFSVALLHLCQVFGLGTSPEGAGMGNGKCFLQGLQQSDPAGLSWASAAPCPTILLGVCVSRCPGRDGVALTWNLIFSGW